MRAIVVEQPGGPEQMRIGEAPTPEAGRGEVRLKVVAAGVNRADLLQCQGHYPPPEGASDIIGLEVSGTVDQVGAGVTGWRPGDRAVALLAGGGYAEYAVVPAEHVAPVPEGVDPATAGGLIEAAATVVSNLAEAGLRPGETLLVHGGAGGIGSFAVPYAARVIGARVLATAGTAAKTQACVARGAAAAFDYHGDWAAQVREATGGRGPDGILDIIGAKYLDTHLRLVAPHGRLQIIGLQGGSKGTANLGLMLDNWLTINGTGLRSRDRAAKARIVAEVVRTVWPAYASGAVPLPEVMRYPLERAAEAHRALAAGATTGKLVLTL
ncbi:MAG: NAD(P)H-quinone oxidoreductase [Bifidobacteriaceae bacterium]|jgi:putative PIG3 family NAD(P)H quinone oxidoreductase|nr:NAD(P)H-quinone oxidoreductase [Bifidobacteriaceae bacterium]